MEIKFKSIPIFWNEEKKGNKSNTLRDIDEKDERFKLLRKKGDTVLENPIKIRIENTETGEEFERIITHVMFFTASGLCLISWRH